MLPNLIPSKPAPSNKLTFNSLLSYLWVISTLIISLSISGCSLLDLKQNDQELEKQLNNIQHWQARGKLSVATPEDTVTGYLTWQQNEQDFDLFISGPFGQGSSRLVGNHTKASLTLPGKDPIHAPSADYLMSKYVGWTFPVLDIRYWVKGQASPHSPSTEIRNSMGLLDSLNQHNWDVQFSQYQRAGDTWLPGRIKITGHAFKFTFIIKEWTINE